MMGKLERKKTGKHWVSDQKILTCPVHGTPRYDVFSVTTEALPQLAYSLKFYYTKQSWFGSLGEFKRPADVSLYRDNMSRLKSSWGLVLVAL